MDREMGRVNTERAVMTLTGRLDLRTVPSLRKKLMRSIQRSTDPEVMVDLSAVDYMDTAGIALLVEWQRQLAKRGARLLLGGVNGDLRRRISLARLDQLFELRTPDDFS